MSIMFAAYQLYHWIVFFYSTVLWFQTVKWIHVSFGLVSHYHPQKGRKKKTYIDQLTSSSSSYTENKMDCNELFVLASIIIELSMHNVWHMGYIWYLVYLAICCWPAEYIHYYKYSLLFNEWIMIWPFLHLYLW